MNQILIVEDDTSINHMICNALKKEGIECIQAFSGTEALLYCKNMDFDLILLDLMLPGKSGEEVLKELRTTKKVPIIILSAKDALDHKVDLLLNGADDYITKPFELKELTARIAVQLRRFGKTKSKDKITFKELCLEKESHKVSVCETELNLTRQEFQILELLLSNPNKVFSKQEMYEYAWEDYYIGEDKTLNVHISNIRNKIKMITEEAYIETVWGIGFKLAK